MKKVLGDGLAHWSAGKKQVKKIRFMELFLTRRKKNRSARKKQAKKILEIRKSWIFKRNFS